MSLPGSGQQDLKKLLHAVGVGRRRARDLTEDEAETAMAAILDGRMNQAQAAAFLISERIKMESAAELTGFARAYEARIHALPPAGGPEVCVHGPLGRGDACMILSLPAAVLLASAGVSVTLVGEEREARKPRGAAPDSLQGFTARPLIWWSGRQVDMGGGAVLRVRHQLELVPALVRAAVMREALGLRTALNTIEKFGGYVRNATRVCGYFHAPYTEPIAASMLALNAHGVLVIGVHGTACVRSDRPTKWTRAASGSIVSDKIQPADFGLNAPTPTAALWDANPAALAEQAMYGEGPLFPAAAFSAALWWAGMPGGPVLEEAVRRLREQTRSGGAAACWRKLVEFARQ